MDDNTFIGYVELHSETERALFHVDDVNRFLRLAGDDRRYSHPDFIAMHSYDIRELLNEAKRRLRKGFQKPAGAR